MISKEEAHEIMDVSGQRFLEGLQVTAYDKCETSQGKRDVFECGETGLCNNRPIVLRLWDKKCELN